MLLTHSSFPKDEVSASWTEADSQLAFYSAYHRDDTNKLIHFIFVPALCM
jgi:hypothetical protein